ncbi:MAG: GSCFA domain-containing protein [Rhodospirillaceae bacterium]
MLRPVPPVGRYHKIRQVPRTVSTPQEFDQTIDRAVLANLMPKAPFIDRSTPITTIGSCFAGNIAAALTGAGYNVHHLDVSERLFNPFALQAFTEALSAAGDLSDFSQHWKVEPQTAANLRNTIAQGGLLIITFGLAFVWIDKTTNEIVFDPTQKTGSGRLMKADPERFVMEPTGVAENVDAIAATLNAVRRISRNINIVMTLSPVHMARAISDYPAVAADAISKSTLRCALHEILSLRLQNTYYFPSFEILRWFGPMVDVTFGGVDIQHIDPAWVAYTLSKFRQYYCVGELPILPPFVLRKPFETVVMPAPEEGEPQAI